MLYFGSLASSRKPIQRYLYSRMLGKVPLNQPQEWSSHRSRKENNKQFLPIEYYWLCHSKGWGSRKKIKLVPPYTHGVKATGYHYGTVLHSGNALGEFVHRAARGSRLCEFR